MTTDTNIEQRTCPLCGTEYSRVADTPKRRVYDCGDGCGAYEVITKGKSSWWYHGAQLPEDMAPSWLESVASAFDEQAA